MDINKRMQDAFNKQISFELQSSNLYLEMAFWFRKEGWKGFAAWMFKQSDEEKQHALAMAEFVLDRGGEAHVGELKPVASDFADPRSVFEIVMEHERYVTEGIYRLADIAAEERDYASGNFVAKFVDEQVEEEKSVRDILNLFKHRDGNTVATIDDIVGAR